MLPCWHGRCFRLLGRWELYEMLTQSLRDLTTSTSISRDAQSISRLDDGLRASCPSRHPRDQWPGTAQALLAFIKNSVGLGGCTPSQKIGTGLLPLPSTSLKMHLNLFRAPRASWLATPSLLAGSPRASSPIGCCPVCNSHRRPSLAVCWEFPTATSDLCPATSVSTAGLPLRFRRY